MSDIIPLSGWAVAIGLSMAFILGGVLGACVMNALDIHRLRRDMAEFNKTFDMTRTGRI